MKLQITRLCFVMCCALSLLSAAPSQQSDEGAAAFTFSGVGYIHRFTESDQHEYTPAGQADLDAWKDMVTLRVYRKAKDGEALAATANTVLENYKAGNGLIVKTDSVPRTRDKPAEHLIVAVFGRPEYIEVAFARLRMYQGTGSAVIYSHRIYGRKMKQRFCYRFGEEAHKTNVSAINFFEFVFIFCANAINAAHVHFIECGEHGRFVF